MKQALLLASSSRIRIPGLTRRVGGGNENEIQETNYNLISLTDSPRNLLKNTRLLGQFILDVLGH